MASVIASDSVPVVPGLSFADQINELASYLVRSFTSQEARDAWLQSIAANLTPSEGSAAEGDVSKENKKAILELLVKAVVDSNGALTEGTEREIESSHLLLISILLSTLSAESADFSPLYTQVLGAVGKGAQKLAATGKAGKGEVGYRVLINSYNLLPTSSALRPATLLQLLEVLAVSTTLDLSALPLTPSTLEASVNAWSLSADEKASWLCSAADVYEKSDSPAYPRATALEQALKLRMLALSVSGSPKSDDVDATVAKALAVPEVFSATEVLRIQGAKENLGPEMKQVVKMLETDEVDVESGLKWIEANKSAVEGAGLPAATLSKKFRLLNLLTLCAKSQSRDVPYSSIASALKIEENQVESWVIDAIRLNLLKARLSQPKRLLHVQSVHSRSFGSEDWQLLGQRLGEWKTTIDEVRQVVDEAMKKAAASEQGPSDGQRSQQRRRREQQPKENGEQQSGADSKQQPTEVAAA